MTKIHKVSKDMYELVRDDSSVHSFCDAHIAQQKLAEINSAVEQRSKSDEHIKSERTHRFWVLREYIKKNNTDEFKRYLKSIKSCSEVKFPTGSKVFSEEKYNAKLKSIADKKAQLIRQFNAIANDTNMGVNDKTKALYPLRKQIDELHNTILLKDEEEFQVMEYETIKIKPLEAFETVVSLTARWDKEYEEANQRALDAAIAADTLKLKDIDEDDFALIKRLRKLVEPTAFFNMFQFNYYPKKEVFNYDSKEAYIHRKRGVDAKFDFSYTDEETQCVMYLYHLKQEFETAQSEKKLKDEAESLLKSL